MEQEGIINIAQRIHQHRPARPGTEEGVQGQAEIMESRPRQEKVRRGRMRCVLHANAKWENAGGPLGR